VRPDETALLELSSVTAGFGSTTVLHGVDLAVAKGEIAGVFGLNGAGKSVTMKVIAGIVEARSGRVHFGGRDVTRLDPEDRVALGMGHVPQGRQVFPGLTVEQNLRLGGYPLRRRDRARYDELVANVYERFPILAERRQQLAGSMSGGQQAALAVGRALVSDPQLLLVDEPSAGLAPSVVAEVGDILRQANAGGVTVLLVEQNVAFGLGLVNQAFVLERGRVVYGGDVAELDQERVASLLGIGRLLSSRVRATVAARRRPARRTSRA
jgi:branched-chain amino acid transport system ATP-binding protein